MLGTESEFQENLSFCFGNLLQKKKHPKNSGLRPFSSDDPIRNGRERKPLAAGCRAAIFSLLRFFICGILNNSGFGLRPPAGTGRSVPDRQDSTVLPGSAENGEICSRVLLWEGDLRSRRGNGNRLNLSEKQSRKAFRRSAGQRGKGSCHGDI